MIDGMSARRAESAGFSQHVRLSAKLRVLTATPERKLMRD